MQKILTAAQIRMADAYTIANEPVSSADLMERAGIACFNRLIEMFSEQQEFSVFCGTGNNGGDGLVIARHLSNHGKEVTVYVIGDVDKGSPDFILNFERMKLDCQNVLIICGVPEDNLIENTIIIDALFGSGLNRAAEAEQELAIRYMNSQNTLRISVDIPSGLMADSGLPHPKAVAVIADYTLSLQMYKLCMMLPDCEKYLGEVRVIPIGLHAGFLADIITDYQITERAEVAPMFATRRRFSHKGNFGHALIFAGSYGKMGAAILSSRACLRTGAGLLTAAVIANGIHIMQTAIPEAMILPDDSPDFLSRLPELNKYNALAFGMGCGTHAKTAGLLKLLIQNTILPVLIDADGINILAENKTWLAFLPKGSILTPHVGEFDRLAGQSDTAAARLEKARGLSKRFSLYLVLKGAYTAVCCPDGKVWFNPTGNPGMATAGSGDVLSGIILSLLAQGLHPKQAAIGGVFLHGLAGDCAKNKMPEASIIASDIVDNIPEAIYAIRAGN